jgi:6-pyruvoyltetrahydropterin/6-carboxytetrahydropterin synthase
MLRCDMTANLASMYEVGMIRRFRAFHVMPDDPGPEGKLHAHDYRLEVVVARPELDDRGMVVDLDVLKESLTEVVGPLEGRDLDAIRGDAYAVTVEVLARWVHTELSRRLGADKTLGLRVRAWESDDAFGGFSDQGPGPA